MQIKDRAKKLVVMSFLLVGMFFLAVPHSFAVDCGSDQLHEDPSTHLCVPGQSNAQGVAGARSVNDLVIRVINVMLAIAAIIAVLYIVIGGYRYITSAGNDDQAKKGRQTVTNALIGLAIIILAYALVSIVNNVVTNCGGVLSRFGVLFGC